MKTKRLHQMMFMAVFAMFFCACGNGQQTLNVTENGVEPFLMDSCFLDIPPRGSFYDTILLNRYYTVSRANERSDIPESELRAENKRRISSLYEKPYDKIEGCYGTGAVMRDKDTLLVVKYNEQATIFSVEILSDLSNVKASKKVSKGEQDENYKASLRVQMSDLKKMEEVVQNGGFGDKEKLLKWMQGTWTLCFEIGDHDTPVSERLVVNGEIITTTAFGVEGAPGAIKYYDIEKGFLIYGEGKRLEFDNRWEIIYYNRQNNWVYEKQTPSTINTPRESSSNSHSSSDSWGSQYSSLRARFDKLNEEGTRITERFDRERWTGARPDWIFEARRLREINDEKISIALQMGDEELLRISRYQKSISEAALSQMGF